jgi:hypothetical protein
LKDPSSSYGFKDVLVEKMFDTGRFTWTKWNNNSGPVDGKWKHMPIDVRYELRRLNLGATEIIEEDEDAQDDRSSDEDETNNSQLIPMSDFVEDTSPSEYLQAFSHFSYRFTNKRVMVCDLQGVYNTDLCPPTIEMTDPAIHCSSLKGRRSMFFGRTDKGKTGMELFFKVR